MTATLETIDRRRGVQALSPAIGDVKVVCNDVRDEDGELVIELEVRLPLQRPTEHQHPRLPRRRDRLLIPRGKE